MPPGSGLGGGSSHCASAGSRDHREVDGSSGCVGPSLGGVEDPDPCLPD
jgi:hypothetical protein